MCIRDSSQVLLNFLSNAIRFTYTGNVTLQVKRDASDRKLLNFLIKDTGIGMLEKDIEKMKTAFRSVAAMGRHAFLKKMSGLGLGLTVSQSLLLYLGTVDAKAVEITSDVNAGSSFSFSIEDKRSYVLSQGNESERPVSEYVDTEEIAEHKENSPNLLSRHLPLYISSELKSLSQLRPAKHMKSSFAPKEPLANNANDVVSTTLTKQLSSQVPSSCRCPKVLVVDDNEFNVSTLAKMLSVQGFTSDYAFNGQMAIDLVVDRALKGTCCKAYKLILMDYDMPVLNGIEATVQLKSKMQREIIAQVPIVACTAFSSKSDMDNCFKAGMDGFISKPIKMRYLQEILARWIKDQINVEVEMIIMMLMLITKLNILMYNPQAFA
eukprot:TRINITY_DN12870_c0_g1_i2.p1 TRINITY_DN12870_c0_g1~~TRINITY_DN12870_c0_g1_i2.p1  ORF type:complete len:394 (-),score=34.84 TRINITY_DN12870_c0_g1_i2:40-1176(-)